jgi:hypothetical protein
MSEASSREVLKARIENERKALADALCDLSKRAGEELDLRRRVRAHPSAWLVGAVAIGFLLGLRR